MGATLVSAAIIFRTALVCRVSIKNMVGTSIMMRRIIVPSGNSAVVSPQPIFLSIIIRIYVPEHKLNIDLDRGDNANGTTIHLWYQWDTPQQTWKFEEGEVNVLEFIPIC
jgi:hypothetical protein